MKAKSTKDDCAKDREEFLQSTEDLESRTWDLQSVSTSTRVIFRVIEDVDLQEKSEFKAEHDGCLPEDAKVIVVGLPCGFLLCACDFVLESWYGVFH